MSELLGWLLVGFSCLGMYAACLEISSWLGLGVSPWPRHLMNPLASWTTGIIFVATFLVNLFLVLYVLETLEAGAKKED